MHVWQLQKAKAELARLVSDAKIEPQIISRHGVPETVVMSIQKYEELLGVKHQTALDFFKSSPLYGVDIDLERDKTASARDVDL